MTATELAKAANYENYNAANLQYGKLGQALATELNYNPRTREDGTPIWTSVLADSPEHINLEELDRSMARREEDGHFEWKLRPQVVEALQGRKQRP